MLRMRSFFTQALPSSPFLRVSNPRGFPVKEMVISDNLVVGNPVALEKKKAAIRNAGLDKLQVIADFDATLTKYWVNGCRGQSTHGLLQQGNPQYDVKRRELFDYYHPLEFSPTIPLEEKTKLMEEWWEKTHSLLLEGGLTYDAIKRSVSNAIIEFRDGVVKLFELLEEKGVPILIFSAGLADIIEEVLGQKLHRSFKNVNIVSNRMIFDDSGHLVAFRGDHIGDLGMSDGLKYENRISIGFLNDDVEKSIEGYRQAFDIVFLNDASMWGVVDLVTELASSLEHRENED